MDADIGWLRHIPNFLSVVHHNDVSILYLFLTHQRLITNNCCVNVMSNNCKKSLQEAPLSLRYHISVADKQIKLISNNAR